MEAEEAMADIESLGSVQGDVISHDTGKTIGALAGDKHQGVHDESTVSTKH